MTGDDLDFIMDLFDEYFLALDMEIDRRRVARMIQEMESPPATGENNNKR